MPAAKGMTQEAIYQDEKNNGIERWVFIGIEKIPPIPDGSFDYYNKHRIFAYNLPREVYERRKWVITWRVAKLQCMFPRCRINPYYSYYDKKTNLPLWKGPLDKLISAKRMVTLITNRMAEAKMAYIPTLYNPTIESTESWLKAAQKLEKYKCCLVYYSSEVERIKLNPTLASHEGPTDLNDSTLDISGISSDASL